MIMLVVYLLSFLLSLFFFQAEDGIRCKLVTGVQTCALPIYVPVIPLDQRVEMLEALDCVDIVRPYHELEYVSEIGRASCRERV